MNKAIGIVGGVGPYAGLDLNRKIFDNTLVSGRDQDHLEVHLLSCSPALSDRSEYLLGASDQNPAEGILAVIQKLAAVGSRVVGIPCNTSHSAAIFSRIQHGIAEKRLDIELLHMVEETYLHCRTEFPDAATFGLLCTKGTYQSGIYSAVFEGQGHCRVLVPDEQGRQIVHDSVYDTEFGIKARCWPVSEMAKAMLLDQAMGLLERGAEVLILGCTEIPLALDQSTLQATFVDPTEILARALIRTAAPAKLKALHPVGR